MALLVAISSARRILPLRRRLFRKASLRPQECGHGGFPATTLGLHHIRMCCATAAPGGIECSDLGPRQVVDNLHAVRQVREVLKAAPWSPSVEQALEKLDVGYSTPIVTQVLRCDIPTDTNLSFFNWVKNLEGIHKFDIYGLMVARLRKAGCIDEILTLLEELRHSDFERTAANFNCLLSHYWREKQLDGALNVWRQMEEAGIIPSSCAYDKLIDLYLRTKRCADAATLFSRMLREGCTPTADTYTLFVKHFAEIGKPDVAHAIFTKLPVFKLIRSTALFLIILSAYARVGNDAVVKALGKELRESGKYPMWQIERTLGALTKAGEIEDAEMIAVEVWPELSGAERSYKLSMLESILAASNEEEVQHFAHDEGENDEGLQVDYDPCVNPDHLARALTPWTPNTVLCLEDARVDWTSQLVIDVLKRIRETDIAWKFFDWLHEQSKFKRDRLTVSKMILMLASYGDVSVLRELLDKAAQEDLHLSSVVVEAAITAFAKSRNSDEAISTLRAMNRFGIEPTVKAYQSVIHVLVQERRCLKAKDFFEQMLEAGLQPTLLIFSLLIRCFGRAGMTDIAHSIFLQIHETGQKPDADAYAFIIRAHFFTGKTDAAMNLFEQSQASGVAPTNNLIEAVVKGLKRMFMRQQAIDFESKYKPIISRRNELDAEEMKQLHGFLLRNLVELDISQLIGDG